MTPIKIRFRDKKTGETFIADIASRRLPTNWKDFYDAELSTTAFDSNGVEIWDGDYVKYHRSDSIRRVLWHEDRLAFVVVTMNGEIIQQLDKDVASMLTVIPKSESSSSKGSEVEK